MNRQSIITRREACVLGMGALGACVLGLSGCAGTDEAPTSTAGFASDTEVKDYAVRLKLYADNNLKWHTSSDGRVGDLEGFAKRYQHQADRSDVTFEIEYVDPPKLLELAQTGFPDGDALVALKDTVSAGYEAGTVDVGVAGLSARDLSYHFSEQIVMVRAAGSSVEMPAAPTIDGKDSSDGTYSQLQQLPQFAGLVAVADPAATTEGQCVNEVLRRQGLYSPDTGAYDASVASKLVFYPDQDSAMAAVASGACQMGFAFAPRNDGLVRRYPQVEQCYVPPAAYSAFYHGTALSIAAEPGVVRDFFEFMLRCTDTGVGSQTDLEQEVLTDGIG